MMVFVEDSHPVLASERGLRRLLLGFRRDGVGEECPHIDTPFGYFPQGIVRERHENAHLARPKHVLGTFCPDLRIGQSAIAGKITG